MMGEPQILFITGVTASGKSALAVELAELINAEIVSADAYQVYQGMPVLTAMPSPEMRERIPHHMIDFLPVWEHWDASLHYKRAMECIRTIRDRGKHVIVVGGSGLYLKFLSHGLAEAPTDAELRAELSQKPLAALVEELERLDPEGAGMTNLLNKRYVERNLEIVIAGGKPLSYWKKNWDAPPVGAGWMIDLPVEEIDERIRLRAHSMMAHGVLGEVAALPPCSVTAEKTLGLREIRQCLSGEISREECVEALFLQTRRYAKRQRTWLRRESWLSKLRLSDFSSLFHMALHISKGIDPCKVLHNNIN